MCVRSPNSAHFLGGSILVSYVRCFVMGDVLGVRGSVPGVAAVVCFVFGSGINFFQLTFSDDLMFC